MTDTERIDWLEADPVRVEDVHGYMSNEGATVRGAIDRLAVLQGGEDENDGQDK